MSYPTIKGAEAASVKANLQRALGGWRGPAAPVVTLPNWTEMLRLLVAHVDQFGHSQRQLSRLSIEATALRNYAESIGDVADALRMDQIRIVLTVAAEHATRGGTFRVPNTNWLPPSLRWQSGAAT